MRLSELFESSGDGLALAMQDIGNLMIARDITTMPSEKFLRLLAKRGYNLSMDELIVVNLDTIDTISAIDRESVTTSQEASVDQSAEVPVDVSDMASNQAMSDIKADI